MGKYSQSQSHERRTESDPLLRPIEIQREKTIAVQLHFDVGKSVRIIVKRFEIDRMNRRVWIAKDRHGAKGLRGRNWNEEADVQLEQGQSRASGAR